MYAPRKTESLLAIVSHTLKGLAFDSVLILLINILIKIWFIAVISHEKSAQEKDNEVGTHELGPAASSVNPSAVGTAAPPAVAAASGTAAVEASSSRRNETVESDAHSVDPQHLQALKAWKRCCV